MVGESEHSFVPVKGDTSIFISDNPVGQRDYSNWITFDLVHFDPPSLLLILCFSGFRLPLTTPTSQE